MSNIDGSTKADMWQMITNSISENMEKSSISILCDTICKNLIFHDPGLFSSNYLENDEKFKEEVPNTWLINQLLYNLTITNDERVIHSNVSLQKGILSASILKQSWFFEKILKEYINIMKVLIDIKIIIGESVEIASFHMEDNNYMITLNPDASFRKIILRKVETRDTLLENLIIILSHAMTIGLEGYEEIFTECSKYIFIAFDLMRFNVKLVSIEYLTKLLWKADESNPDIMNYVTICSEGIFAIIGKILIWLKSHIVKMNQIEKFSRVLANLLQALPSIKYNSQSECQKTIFKIWINILHLILGIRRKPSRIVSKEVELALIKYLTISLKKSSASLADSYDFTKLYSCLNMSIDIIKAMEPIIMKDIEQSPDETDLMKISETWRKIHEIFIKSLNTLSGEKLLSEEDSTNHLHIISEIIIFISNVNYSYQLWHQEQHLKQGSGCKICLLKKPHTNEFTFINGTQIAIINLQFFSDIQSFINNFNIFLTKQNKSPKMNLHNFCLLSDIAGFFLLTPLISQFSTSTQINLIDLVALIFQIKLKIPSKTSIPYIEDLFPEYEEKIEMKCFSLLANIETNILTRESSLYLKDLIIQIILKINGTSSCVQSAVLCLIINKMIPLTTIENNIIKPAMESSKLPQFLSIKDITCLLYGDVFVFKTKDNFGYNYKIICNDCDNFDFCNCIDEDQQREFYLNLIKDCRGSHVYFEESPQHSLQQKDFESIFNNLTTEEISLDLKAIPTLLSHLELIDNKSIEEKWIQLLAHTNIHIRYLFSNQVQFIVKIILTKPPEIRDQILERCVRVLLNSVKESLIKTDKSLQSAVINMILKFSTVDDLPEKTLLHLFRMTFMYLIRYESVVAHQAALCAGQMCSKHGITPKNMLNWHKQDILKLITSLCVSIYLRNNVGLYSALSNITKMLGFIGPKYFIRKHYKLIVAMLLPWCIKFPTCVKLLEEVASILQQDLQSVLTSSFLTTYPYLFLNESAEINNKCLDFIIKNTEKSLYNLLQSDIKRTIAEILIYYHKNPSNVMKVFRCLLQKDDTVKLSSDIPHAEVAEYIATRFLGVLTFFEACLVDPDFEKSLKTETLLSFGEIIRFIGSKHITPFRFKILAMLRTTLTLNDATLKEACARVWNIFIHTVDIVTLGPLLSTIVASLEPLLTTNSDDVNSIYKYLILSNGSLLSLDIPDLYFIENLPVTSEIKNFIAQQTEKVWKGDRFIAKFKFFLTQIKHENLAVRVYGLNYLTQLFAKNRNTLNKLILGQSNMNPILESVLEILMIGCRHIDKNLQLASGKCLGELGAIEPSHIPPNYAPQRNFSLNIHTDSFAIMALEELCRAYQFQKDTKYVDSFSLAIQEILLDRGVCPKTKKKMEVWEAIPERMRQLMEPLLTSCYTAIKTNINVKAHPVFGSAKCQTYEQWASTWAAKMIETVQEEETRHLLNSFKPAIRRDSNTMALFLPYIIFHALQSCGDAQYEEIYDEFQCVFKAAVNKEASATEINKTRKRALKTLQFKPSAQTEKNDEPTEYIGIKCAKIGFEQLDFLERWLREWRKAYTGHSPNKIYQKIELFLSKFDKKLIAQSNYNCGEYARALMYLESYIENNKSCLQENLSFLAEIYADLMDPDSLEGAIGLKKTELTLSEQILVNNMTDRLLDSTACFEQLMQSDLILPSHVKDIVECYLRLDTPETALLVSDGLINQLGERYLNDFLKETQAEPLWRLGRFDELERLMKTETVNESTNWGVQCGQALLCFRKADTVKFDAKIENIRCDILKLLRTGGVEQNSYHKGYPQVMKLHLITEIEKAKELAEELSKPATEREYLKLLNEFFKNWDSRLALLQPTPRITEPVLCLRRILLDETKQIIISTQKSKSMCTNITKLINNEIAKMWIRSSELTRNAGWYQQAQLGIMNAEQYKPENLFIEKAKLFWKKGDQTNCFRVIEQKLQEVEEMSQGQGIGVLPENIRNLYAEAKFLQATYNAESMNISTELNIRYFKESLAGNQKSEKCLVHYAQYLDKIYGSMSEEKQQNLSGREILYEIMLHYGKSMSFGCEYIYQSMPRMLSVWFDFTSQMIRDEHYRKISRKMNEIVEKFAEDLPLFIFFTAFSQLVSRICHPSTEVYNVLKTIIVRLIQKFPQQSLWMILPVFKSSYANRVKRCTEIFNDRRLSQPSMQTLITDFNSLAEKLIELTNKEIPSTDKKPTVSNLVRQLPRLFANAQFSHIIMPFQQFMQPVLPPIDERNSPANAFDAFPNKAVYIKGIKEEIQILMSLQKPRRVTLLGTDGKNYDIMLKPKDDLRKDFRLMEFNAVVKQYLHQDPDARERRLGIRTYAVIPLNEECGVIEWVQNLHAFRQILMGYYKQRNLAMPVKELKAAAGTSQDSIKKRRDVFLNTLLPRHPPLFSEWFKERFTTPHNWYQARTSYIRTTSVMSIVGYILGLGDRHGENILFDGTNGDAVHVDFNCLFNKGETFQYPEKVPFRLTHNMIQAMGPLGVEGLYRKCCEITMRVLQAQTPTLMSVLRPFVYDPLVSWSRSDKAEGNSERTDPLAMANVKLIEERLKGFVKIKGRTSNMPLSTEGQVNFIISEATNIDNLASMYIGWGAYL